MLLRWLLAIVHLLGFAIGLGSVWARYRTLRGSPDRDGMQRAILADNWWALSAALLIGTGLLRAFVGFEKGADYYLGNHLFRTKLVMLGLILALEVVPVICMVQWRGAFAGGRDMDLGRAALVSKLSLWQALLLLTMLVLATGMARGIGT